MARLAAPYLPRQPQETLLYKLVSEHLSDFLQHARDAYEGPVPRYVEDEFRGYLRCGDFAHGFVHTECETCTHALLVAFSCKSRGVCPSCSGRRMAGSAAHLVDRVMPAAPIRQYVLSFPFELSGLAATKPEVLTALSRIFWETLRRHYRRWAKGAGYTDVETGAVTGVQRFGSSLNLHVHMHTLALDGVYVKGGDAVCFVAAPPPTRCDLLAIALRIHDRVMKWLARHNHLRDPESSNAMPDLSVGDALATVGMQRGELVTVPDDEALDATESSPPLARDGDAVTHERFNLHASVTLRADDDMGRERLCRYITRPAFSLARISVRKDGMVSYRVKKLGRRKATHRVMTPVEFVARLSSLIPPPRFPLLRFHGVLAPRHPWRVHVVPRPPLPIARKKREKKSKSEPSHKPEPRPSGDGRAAFVMPVVTETRELTESSSVAERVGPNIIAVAHWERLLGGELYATSSRPDWALLLRRTFDTDIRVCSRCGGKLRVRAVITDEAVAKKIVGALRQHASPARAPPIAHA